MVEIMATDAKKNRPMKNQDEREEDENGAESPPSPGAPPFAGAVAKFVHEVNNLFPRG